ncbi:MASE4 domain-containing protein [Acidovorax sp. sif0715]|nr:MASE4 domain-containing protein [Acidovorax sp. sif0715]
MAMAPAGPVGRRWALGAVVVSAVLFLAAMPFAKLPLPKMGAFIPAYQSALVLSDLITAVMLWGQYRILGHAGLRVLACGYLFTALVAITHALTFPGLVAEGGWLGAGPQSTAWLYMFWHAGFPAAVIGYALSKPAAASQPEAAPAQAGFLFSTAISVAAVLAAVAALTALATVGQSLLPPIMQGSRYTPTMLAVVTTVWGVSVVALLLLLRRRPLVVLDLLLVVTMCAWLFDIALSAVLNGGRFDLGFYAGRLYGLMASTALLAVLLVENTMLHARLAAAYQAEREKRRQIQTQAAELVEKNRELDAFSYSISHDLQAPVRVIQGFAGMLLERSDSHQDAETRRMLKVIDDSARKMGQLIRDLLDFARLGRQPMHPARVDMNALVEQVIADVRHTGPGRDAAFAVASLPEGWGDRALLRQVWVNLISNAVKYSGPQGAHIQISGSGDGGECVYQVADQGIGFDMARVDRLFELFQRLHTAEEFPGTGVGLAFVQRIVVRHGGRVWALGALNAGATFSFALPQAPTPQDAGGTG